MKLNVNIPVGVSGDFEIAHYQKQNITTTNGYGIMQKEMY